jgi:inorganic pyrophosphatase
MESRESLVGKRAGAVVYRLDEGLIKHLLVTQKPRADQWILPQGKQIPGETLKQTAHRETYEESGCEVKIQDELGSFTVISHGEHWTTLIFLARLISTGPSPESREITWKSIEEVDSLPIPSETRQLLKKAQSILDNRIQKAEQLAISLLGKRVVVTVNRPIGTKHAGIHYRTNYGYIEGVIGKDGDPLDAYLLGVNKPVNSFEGKCIAVIKRINDLDDKLIVVPQNLIIDPETIRKETHFVEKFFESDLILMQGLSDNV